MPSTLLFRPNSHLPDWSEKRFVVLDPSKRWATAISLQLHQQVPQSPTSAHFENTETTRETLLLCESTNTVGLIVFLEGVERDCLGLLRQLGRSAHQPTVLVVGRSVHVELMPVMMESGATGFLIDVENDIPIARWCHNLLRKTSLQ